MADQFFNNIADEMSFFDTERDMRNKDFSVLIEYEKDRAFWEYVFDLSLPNAKPDFPKRPSRPTGKDELSRYRQFTSPKLLICIDSDNDHLRQTKYSNWINPRPAYLFHTYTHSRENHLLYPANLSKEISAITGEEIDFTRYFNGLSQALVPWLLVWLYFTSDRTMGHLKKHIERFDTCLSWESLESLAHEVFSALNEINSLEEIHETISDLEQKISTYCDEVVAMIPDELSYYRDDFTAFVEFEALAYKNSALFFIQGHCAFDAIVLPVFNSIVKLSTRTKISHQKHDYRERLSLSYRLCNAGCSFMNEIKKYIIADLGKE